MEYILIVNPKEEMYEKYQAVLIGSSINGEGMTKGYPSGMDFDTILGSVCSVINSPSNRRVEIKYNSK
jgi:hypothetical protein